MTVSNPESQSVPPSHQVVDAAPHNFRQLITVPAASDHKKIIRNKWPRTNIIKNLRVQRTYVAPQGYVYIDTRIIVFYGKADQHTIQPKQTKIPQTELSVFDVSTSLIEHCTCSIHTCIMECSTNTSRMCKPLRAKTL